MAASLERRDQPDTAPSQSFPGGPPPQANPAPYPYQTSEYPSLDQELTMTDNYPPPAQQSLVSQLQDAAATSAPQNGGDLQGINVNTNGTGAAGMAPPQTPVQPGFSPTEQRTSVDDTSDPAVTGDGTKRKRSKVSRACDECRRKKVKCDAAAEDGTIKTCTNCTKAGLLCEYSRIPMKRGPSKGYIKELSERVQQVESLQAAMSGPGYRQSLDGSSVGFAESFSPDDPMSLKRNYSFPDTRNPFSSSEFQRDRIPSVGAWGANSPVGQGFRLRDRGSLAIAPDQQLPPIAYSASSKPFWSEKFDQPPPAKRQKLEEDSLEPLSIDSAQLSDYYQLIQPNFPLLPDLDTTLSILRTASPQFQHVFAITLELLPSTTKSNHENQNGDQNVARRATSVFTDHEKLSDVLDKCSRRRPQEYSDADSLVLLWSYVLLAISTEYNMAPPGDGVLSRSRLIKQAMDLAFFLKHQDKAISSNVDATIMTRVTERAWEMGLVLAKFNALASGNSDFVILSSYGISGDAAASMPETTAFLARISNSLSTIILQVQDSGMAQSGLMISSRQLLLKSHLSENVLQTRGLDVNAPIVRQVTGFFELLLSRYNFVPTPANILHPAVGLTEALASAPQTASAPAVYNPVEMHLFTLATITILEFLTSISDLEMSGVAETALNTLQPLLEQKVEQHNAARSQIEKAFWKGGEGAETRIVSWPEALTKMIERRRKIGWAAARGDTNGSAIVNTSAMVDFGQLLKVGYATVLARYA